jgi:L-arabinonolactonase
MNNNGNASLIDIIPAANTLGEGPVWDGASKLLWWTDIEQKRLHRYHPTSGTRELFDLPERLGSFGLVEGSSALIAAYESGFALFHPHTRQSEWLQRPEHAAGGVRFNDGRVDRVGRFWAGSMVEGRGDACGQLYCLRKGQVESHLSGISIANSLCFSPDGLHLYFADSPHRTIWRFDMDAASGALSNRSVFAQTPEGAFPDGSNVDCEGHVWNAHWGAGRVVRYAPDGSISGSIELPVSQPTCVAFGGDDLNVLYVTTARLHLKADVLAREPNAGDVFVYQLDIAGIAESRYVQ